MGVRTTTGPRFIFIAINLRKVANYYKQPLLECHASVGLNRDCMVTETVSEVSKLVLLSHHIEKEDDDEIKLSRRLYKVREVVVIFTKTVTNRRNEEKKWL